MCLESWWLLAFKFWTRPVPYPPTCCLGLSVKPDRINGNGEDWGMRKVRSSFCFFFYLRILEVLLSTIKPYFSLTLLFSQLRAKIKLMKYCIFGLMVPRCDLKCNLKCALWLVPEFLFNSVFLLVFPASNF